MIKTLLAAGILRDYEFISAADFDLYVDGLDRRNILYKVIETFERSDGTFLARILQQYNNVDLIEL